MSASEPLRSDRSPARSAGRTVLGVCLAIGLMVLVIVGARLLSGGSIAMVSVALPAVSLGWLAWLAVKTSRAVSAVDPAPLRDERPSRRLPRYDAAAGGRSERPSDSGSQISA